MAAIKTENLTKCYGKLTALDSLSLTVEEGEMLALLGVNGAGKTTAIKLLSCLTPPTSGEATLRGHSILKAPQEVKRVIGVSPQETAVAKKLSVRENLQFIAEIHGFDKQKAAERVEKMLSDLGLSELAARRAGTLSGGWQRRLSIAMALVSEPQILFLDEPTLGLDVIARHELWEHIKALKGKMTVILTTHYLEEVEALCDRVAILAGGKLITVGTVAQIKELAGTDSFEDAFVKLCGKGVRV
ncbi:MAG: ABC transporter ATP-binding protein [Ruminococcaceae bacterium]|nr:ABC transporter ATP-binding protein [Oscillospiraceae bacterium]